LSVDGVDARHNFVSLWLNCFVDRHSGLLVGWGEALISYPEAGKM